MANQNNPNESVSSDRIFLPVSDAARRLSVCTGRVYQLIAEGRLPGIKRGRRTLIPRQAFDAYVEQINRDALRNVAAPSPTEEARP